MRIRTLLIGGTIASGTAVAVVIGYLIVAARTLDVSLAQNSVAGTIIASV